MIHDQMKPEGISVTYYYSACVGIRTKHFSILCDPWFTDGIYDGSWYQYPKLENPIDKIGRYDYIYVSHIHPDHYDPKFLRAYQKKYKNAEIIIANFSHNYLQKKLEADGFKFSVIKELVNPALKTSVSLLPCGTGPNVIDSALVVKYVDKRGIEHVVVNMNDCPWDKEQLDKINKFTRGRCDLALLGYAGASSYPQKHYNLVSEYPELVKEAHKNKQKTFERYSSFKTALRPRKVIPFAGKYILGGDYAYLNPYRGVADPVEVKAFDSDAIILADDGESWVDTATMVPSNIRNTAYDQKDIDLYAKIYCNQPFLDEKYFKGLDMRAVPFERLLIKSYFHAHAKSEVAESDVWQIAIHFKPNKWFICSANANQKPSFKIVKTAGEWDEAGEPVYPKVAVPCYFITKVRPTYLYGLLTGVFHWNNAEVGSHLTVKRKPNKFVRSVHDFLNFFQCV